MDLNQMRQTAVHFLVFFRNVACSPFLCMQENEPEKDWGGKEKTKTRLFPSLETLPIFHDCKRCHFAR